MYAQLISGPVGNVLIISPLLNDPIYTVIFCIVITDNCNAFQYVQSMEIDPNTGYMWIIDV